MKVKNMNVELPYYHVYNENMHALHGGSTMMVFIKNYESKILKIFAQAMVLALLITVLPGVVGARIISHDVVLRNKNMESSMNTNVLNKLDSESLPLVLHDLANEGLISTNDKSLIMSNSLEQDFGTLLQDRDSFVISPVDLKQQGSISDDTFDFSLTNCFAMVQEFIDRTLKLHGIVAVQLNQDPSMAFEVPSNYKIVYFRRFIDDSTYVVMRKTTYAKITAQKSTMKRKLLEFLSEEKKAVLGNLEDVLLEPPRSTKGTSKSYLKKTKFLPDLLNDSLDGYSRRVYIDVGGGHGSTRWFEQHYPTRNKDFDIYRIQTVPETEVVDSGDDAWEGPPTQMGISDWLWRNVKAEEYVVMKADVEVVEEMLKSKAIVLVDELFLECKPFGKVGRNKRAYWECLALYGRLRDFGVAVHQWWG